jgi:hypothetical protein
MRKFGLLSLALCCTIGFVELARAEEDATRAIIEKAIKAHGGIEKLKKLKKSAVQSKAKGKIHVLGGIDVTMEISAQSGKFRQVIEGELNDNKFTQYVLFDGKKLRIYVNDMEIKLDDKKLLKAVQEQLYAEKITGLVFLKDKGIKLAALGEVKVGDTAALGVRVSSEGHKDVNLFFDKAKGLLIKTETRATDFMSGEEKTEEKILKDYKMLDGFLQPTKVDVIRDGKKVAELEIEESKIVDRFDDDTFTKP